MTELDMLHERLVAAQEKLDAANQYGDELDRINKKWRPVEGAPFPFNWIMLFGWVFHKGLLDRRTPLAGRYK